MKSSYRSTRRILAKSTNGNPAAVADPFAGGTIPLKRSGGTPWPVQSAVRRRIDPAKGPHRDVRQVPATSRESSGLSVRKFTRSAAEDLQLACIAWRLDAR